MESLKILIEGSDASGKSTLLKQLEEVIGGNTVNMHFTAPPRELSLSQKIAYMNDVHDNAIQLFDTIKSNIIVDRFHISDLVYLPIFSGGYNKRSGDIVDKQMAKLGFKLVFVTARYKDIVERLNERGDWFVNEDHISDILTNYNKEIRDTRLDVFVYNTSIDQEEQVEQFEELLKFLGINKTTNKGDK